MVSRLSGPKETIKKLYVDWGQAAAQRLKRVLVDSNWGTVGLVNYADEVFEQCGICCASDEDPHILLAGASTVSALHEKLQMGLPFPDDAIALRATDVNSKNSLLLPARSENPKEVCDAVCSSPFLLGRSASKWMKEVNGEMEFGWIPAQRAESSPGLREWARTLCFSDAALGLLAALTTVWRRMIASRTSRSPLKFSGAGTPSYTPVGIRRTNLFLALIPPTSWSGGDDEDLLLDQDTSLLGRLAHQKELRITAQEAALKEVAKGRLRRILEYHKS